MGLALELGSRGHEVAFATGEAAEPVLGKVELARIACGENGGDTFRLQPSPVALVVERDVRHIEHAMGKFAPHVLIANVIGLSALIASELHGIPLCVLSAAEDVGIRHDSIHLVNDLRASFALPPLLPSHAEFPLLADLFLLRSVAALERESDSLPSEVRFVGACDWEPACESRTAAEGCRDEFPALSAPEQRPLIYTQHRHTLDEPRFWSELVEALGPCPVQVYATIARWDYHPGTVPCNFIAGNSLPRAAVLAHADLAISTAKSSAPLAALAHGVRSLLISAVGCDGGEHAKRFERAGCAVQIDSNDLTAARLRDAVDAALGDDRLQQNARRLGSAFARIPDFQVAADHVEQLPLARATPKVPSPM